MKDPQAILIDVFTAEIDRLTTYNKKLEKAIEDIVVDLDRITSFEEDSVRKIKFIVERHVNILRNKWEP